MSDMAHMIILTELMEQETKWDMAVAHEAMLAVLFSYLGDIIWTHTIYAAEGSVLSSITEG